MLTAYVYDIRFMHGIFILLDDDEPPALDSEDSWNPANSEAESDSVDEEAAEKLQNENRDGTYTLPAGEERRDGSHGTIITAADRNHFTRRRGILLSVTCYNYSTMILHDY